MPCRRVSLISTRPSTLRKPASRRSAKASRAIPRSTAPPSSRTPSSAKFKRDNGLTYERNQILVSSGAKQTCFNLCAALLDPGDECLIPAPYWVSYPDMALLADATPVIVNGGADQGYKITPAQLEAAITPAHQAVHLEQPEQPHRRRLHAAPNCKALGAVLDKHPQIVIAADEMYEHIYWAPEPFVSFAQANPQLYGRTVTINGVSKAYAMTGWRIGYCGGPKEIVDRDGHHAGSIDLQRLEHFAARRDRRPQRRPDLRRGNEQGVQGAA